MDQTTLTIGQLARRFGLTASAIRYYERVGVLPEPARESGQRRYDADAVKRVEVLEAAKRAGFSLAEARLLLERTEAGSAASEVLPELAGQKLLEVDALIAWAEAMRSWLLAASGCSCATLDVCGLFGHAGPARR